MAIPLPSAEMTLRSSPFSPTRAPSGHPSRRPGPARLGKLCGCLAIVGSLAGSEAFAQLSDAYGPRVEWQQATGHEVTPIHIGLLPNGRVFLVNNYNYIENPTMNLRAPGFEPEPVFMMDTTPASSPPPASVMLQTLVSPAPLGGSFDAATNTMRFKTVSCSGHALTADGKLFFASGADGSVDMTLYAAGNLISALKVDGIAESFSIDPATLSWTRHPDTQVPGPNGRPFRWYATVTRLADSRMLVTGGYEKVFPALVPNTSVEIFDPSANAWSVVSRVDETPAGIENPDYPHVFQLPYVRGGAGTTALVIGGSGEAMFLTLNGSQKTWVRTQNFRPGARELINASPTTVPNHGASTALLPIRLPGSGWGYSNGSAIQVGGWHHTPLMGQIDVYDPVADSWRPTVALNARRIHPSTVILPDGRILVLGGHDSLATTPEQTGYAEYIDPRNNFTVTRGTDFMPEVRAYHTVALLLPDGRVIIGSGNVTHEDAREWTSFRYYQPDYMFKTRPQLADAPDTIAMGEPFVIAVPRGTRIGEAALVGLGSQTHSYDMNQRHVQVATRDLGLTVRSPSGRWSVESREECRANPGPCFDLHLVQSPPTAEAAPPGHYMLFILDQDRVPSEGKILKLR
jgi:galactose oxidase